MPTEAQAKLKQCQERISGNDNVGGSGVAAVWNCNASLCMAWRWYQPASYGANRLGYCGLVPLFNNDTKSVEA